MGFGTDGFAAIQVQTINLISLANHGRIHRGIFLPSQLEFKPLAIRRVPQSATQGSFILGLWASPTVHSPLVTLRRSPVR